MRVLAFDVETKDPFISRKMTSGWVHKYHNYQDCDFKVLGVSWYDGTDSGYITDFDQLPALFAKYDTIIAHNAQYDLGCLCALGMKDIVDKFYGNIVDTIIAAKLVDSSQMMYGLDYLGNKYKLTDKQSTVMAQAAWDSHVFALTKKEEKEGREKDIPTNKLSRVKNWVITNMDIMQDKLFNVVEEYAIADAVICYDLYMKLLYLGEDYYLGKVEKTFKYWSKLVSVTINYTIRGIRVDLVKADKAVQALEPFIVERMNKIYEIAGEEFNINSSYDVPRIFQQLGLYTGTTATGKPSVTKDILEKEVHPIATLIREAKQYTNIKNNFITKLVNMQQYTMKEGEREDREYGRIHTSFTALAAKTGRFSCSGPNLQQIPKRNPELGPWCRGIFVPEANETLYALDFSNQEGRLQLHYAVRTLCDGAIDMQNKFIQEPSYDLHSEVAEICGMTRGNAKTINLGLSYGMGAEAMCNALGMPTQTITKNLGYKIQKKVIPGKEAGLILERYHTLFPFLKQLVDKATQSAKLNGYTRTLGGRSVKVGRAIIDGKLVKFEHKAFNALIQGSASDQTSACMIKAHEQGIDVLLTVHDELVFSGNEQQAKQLQGIMEHTVPLKVPSVTDIGQGANWYEAH